VRALFYQRAGGWSSKTAFMLQLIKIIANCIYPAGRRAILHCEWRSLHRQRFELQRQP